MSRHTVDAAARADLYGVDLDHLVDDLITEDRHGTPRRFGGESPLPG